MEVRTEVARAAAARAAEAAGALPTGRLAAALDDAAEAAPPARLAAALRDAGRCLAGGLRCAQEQTEAWSSDVHAAMAAYEAADAEAAAGLHRLAGRGAAGDAGRHGAVAP